MKLYKQIRYGSILIVGSSLFISISIFIYILLNLNFKHIKQEHLITNEKITNEVNNYFEDIFSKVRFISRIKGLSENFLNYSEVFQGLMRNNNAIDGVYIVKNNKIALNNTNNTIPSSEMFSMTNYVLMNNEEIASNVFYDTNYKYILFAVPIRNSQDSVTASLIVQINLKYLNFILEQIEINTQDSFFIIDKNILMVASNIVDADASNRRKLSTNKVIINSITNNALIKFQRYSGISDHEVYGTFNFIRSMNWYLLSETPSSTILAPIVSSLFLFTAILVFFLTTVIFVSYKFSLKLIEPLKKLTYAAENFENEEIDLDIKTVNELSLLAQAFISMRNKINHSLDRAKRAETELKIANDELEKRVHERTAELHSANINLSDEIISREIAEVEKDLMYKQLIHSSKLASIGSLAAGIAHEINNPMTIITGYTQIIKSIVAKKYNDQDIKIILEKMELAQNRIISIVHGMRIYARIDSEENLNFNADHEINNTLDIIDPLYKKENITIKIVNEAANTLIQGNTGRFNQVILNLISNAKDAITKNPHEKLITIKISNQNDFLKIEVSDNGEGIPPNILNKIFDPFYTTKDPGKGTGLGLSICQSIIHSMKGNISIESKEKIGTTFTIIVPTVSEITSSEDNKVKDEVMILAGKVIVVEDETDIKNFIVAYLLSFGLTVDSVENGLDALKLIEKEQYDYIVTDLMMPIMNGIDLIRNILDKQIQYKKLIVVTGGVLADFSNFDREFVEKSASSIVQKPFSKDALFKALIN